MDILIPILTLGFLGLIFGIGLALASKKLAVQVDPRLERIHGLLPGANCGACGGAGCFGFAEDILSGKRKIDACRMSADNVKEKIAEVLGRKLQKDVKKLAVLHCNGGVRVKDRFIYKGIEDCVAANLVLGGQKECVFGCLGFDTCAKACPFGAIKMSSFAKASEDYPPKLNAEAVQRRRMSDEGLPVVDINKCKACNKCVEACPKKLFSLVPATHPVYVACSSYDLGKDTKAVCPVGCSACKLCEKACPVDAICVIDNLAAIDYNKCTSCGECVKVCPMKTIQTRITADVKSADIRG